MIQCPDVPVPSPATSNAAGWFWLAIVIAVIVFDVWAWKTGRPTLSQWMKRHVKGKRWVKWLLFGGGFIALVWHVLLGGPI